MTYCEPLENLAMKSSYKRLGDYIRLVDLRNTDSLVDNLLGINITKTFMPSVANVSQTDLSKYKVIKKRQFACNIMHVGRDEKLPIALYEGDKKAIVSPAYKVFEVINENEVLPEFLMIEFKRQEFDRFTWFICDSSIRGGLEWERFCEIELPIPDIVVQRKYVTLYNSLLENQKCQEKTLSDLKLICDIYIEDLIKAKEPQILGDFIERIKEKNTDDAYNSVIGISERKEFRPPAGKVNKKNLSNHLIVRKGELAYIPRMNPFKPLAVALSELDFPVLVSSSYEAFRVTRTDELLPEFLFLFLKREKFDRYAAFHAWSSTRDTFSWDEMCKVKIPIPDIKVQESIIAVHHVLEKRKRMNEQLKTMISKLCPVLISGVIKEVK